MAEFVLRVILTYLLERSINPSYSSGTTSVILIILYFPDKWSLAEFNTAVSDAILASTAGSETLTNKTINFADNTITTTKALLDTAVSDATLVDLDDTQTLTNKTLTSPKINENVALTATATELNLLDGVSGLVQADLTKLAAVDATATELNHTDGVTSNIQTQLDAKAAKSFAIAQAVALG